METFSYNKNSLEDHDNKVYNQAIEDCMQILVFERLKHARKSTKKALIEAYVKTMALKKGIYNEGSND